MAVLEIFRQHGQHLFWRRLTDDRVLGRPSGEPITADETYVVIRLAEMFLGTSRMLWRKFSPLVHVFVESTNGTDQHSVVGPGRLQELGDTNLDRVIVLNQRVAGPIPYRGGEVGVLCGLYSVPRADATDALVSTLSAVSDLAGPEAAAAVKMAEVLKAGVDSILGLGSTVLRLGIRDTFGGGGNPLRSGFHIGLGAPPMQVPADRLWLKDGRLHEGSSAALARPFTASDYLVLQIERLDRRPDWAGLPGLAEFETRFSEVLRGAGDAAAKRNGLAQIWPSFREALVGSPNLTQFDAGQIADDVRTDVKARLDALDAGALFETRAFDGGRRQGSAVEVDFALIDTLGRGTREAGERALIDPWA
jgi:hypothetical protein